MFVRPNILRTLRRTMIRFLTEHLVRQIWFGQSRLYFIVNWLVMRCKLRPELAADAQQTAWWKCRLKSSQVKSVYFNHPSQGNSSNDYLILGLRDKAAPSTSQQINKFPPKQVKNLTTISFWVLRDKAAPSTSQHKSTNKQIPFEASEEPSDTVIHFYFCFFSIHRRALLSANQRQWSSNRANVPRTCWAKVFGPRI